MLVAQEMLYFDGRVKREMGKFRMQGTCDAHGVRGTIEEIGVAKSDMVCTHGYLRPNIGQDVLCGQGKKPSTIDWCDRTVTTGMFAAPCRLRVAHQHCDTIQLQSGITVERGQAVSRRPGQGRAFEPGTTRMLTCFNSRNVDKVSGGK